MIFRTRVPLAFLLACFLSSCGIFPVNNKLLGEASLNNVRYRLYSIETGAAAGKLIQLVRLKEDQDIRVPVFSDDNEEVVKLYKGDAASLRVTADQKLIVQLIAGRRVYGTDTLSADAPVEKRLLSETNYQDLQYRVSSVNHGSRSGNVVMIERVQRNSGYTFLSFPDHKSGVVGTYVADSAELEINENRTMAVLVYSGGKLCQSDIVDIE